MTLEIEAIAFQFRWFCGLRSVIPAKAGIQQGLVGSDLVCGSDFLDSGFPRSDEWGL